MPGLDGLEALAAVDPDPARDRDQAAQDQGGRDGVLEAKGSAGWRNPDDDIWIPLSTGQFRVTGDEYVETISAKVSESSSTEMAMLEIERVLRREHGRGLSRTGVRQLDGARATRRIYGSRRHGGQPRNTHLAALAEFCLQGVQGKLAGNFTFLAMCLMTDQNGIGVDFVGVAQH